MTTAATSATTPLLDVQDLRVRYGQGVGAVPVVQGVSFTLGREKLALVGESGSGKTTVGRALLRLLPRQAQTSASRLQFDGTDLLAASPAQMAALRGRRLAMIMQDPKFSLNPVMTVGAQIAESVQRDRRLTRGECADRVHQLLARVHIREPQRVAGQYAHQLSGGMGQRVMIAMMVVREPDLLIADEPTSALDVTVRTQVLSILDELVTRRGMGLIFVSHDLNLVAKFCDRVIVMYAGRIVETLEAGNLHAAKHPYTQGLLACLPSIDGSLDPLPVLNREASWLEAAS